MRALLVVNPQATATTRAGRDVLAHALASEVKLEVVETDYRGHASAAAAQAVGDGIDLVVAHGGDGTVNEVINGLLGDTAGAEGPMLGVVPGGSANVFARALGLPRDPLEATHRLLQAIEVRRSRVVGLGRADGRWFAFNAGLGWDAEVVAGVERWRAKGREASPTVYTWMALTSYFRLQRGKPLLTVQVNDEEPVNGLHLAFVSNTDPWTYLGTRPMHLNPNCSFDAGLGLFALRNVRAATVLRHLTQVLRCGAHPHGGNLLRRDNVDTVRVTCERPVRLQLDGDHVGERTAVELVSVPGALRVMS
jgi:diacylglycerol kinase family enzyme